MGKLTKIFKKKNKTSFPAEVDAGSPVNETPQSNDSAKTSSENASQLPTDSLEKATGHSAPLMNEAGPGSASAIVREDIENAPFETSKKGNEKKGSSFAAKLISKIGKAFSSKPKEKDPEKQRRKHYLEEASSERDSITALGTYVSYDNLSYDKALQFQYFLDEASSKLDSTRVLSPSDSAESLFTADTNVINSKYVPDVSLTAYSTSRDSISSTSSEVSESVYSAYINNAPIYDVLKDVSLTASKNVEEQSSTSKNVKDKSSASKDVEEKPSSSKKNSSALKRMSNALKKIKFTGPLTKSTKNGTTMNNNPQNKTSAQSSSSEPLYDVPKPSKSKFYVDLPTEQKQTSSIQSPTQSSSEPLYSEPLNYAYHPIPFKTNTEHKPVSPVASPAPSRSSSSSSLDSTTSSKSLYYPTPFKTNTTHKPVSAVTSPTPSSSASSEPLYDVPKASKSQFYVELPTEQKQTSPIQSPTTSSSSEPLYYEPIYEPLNYAYHPIPFKTNTEHKSVSPVASPALSRSSSSSSLDSTTSSKSLYYPTPFKASTESGSAYKPVSAVASPTPSSSTLESKPATSPEPKSWKKAGSVTGAVKVKAAAFESHAQSDGEIKSKSVAPLKPKRGILLSDSIQQGNLSVANSVEGVASSNAQEEHGAQKKELPNVLKKFSNSSHITKLEGMFANAGPASSKPVAVASSPKVVHKEAPALHSAAASTSLSESASNNMNSGVSVANSVEGVASSNAQEEHGAQKKELPNVLKKFSNSSHITKLEGMFANVGPASSKPVAVASSPKVVHKEAPALHSAAASTSLSESASNNMNSGVSVANSVKSVASSNAQEEHGAQKKDLPNVLKKFSNSSHITKLEGMFANVGPASSKPVAVASSPKVVHKEAPALHSAAASTSLSESASNNMNSGVSVANSVKSVASSNAQEEHGAQKKDLPNVLKKFSNSSHITKLEGMFANVGPASSKPVAVASSPKVVHKEAPALHSAAASTSLSESASNNMNSGVSVANSVKSVASSNAQEEHGAQKKELPNVLKKFSNSSHITKLEGMFANAGPASSKPVAVASSPKVVHKEAPALHSAAASTSLSESASNNMNSGVSVANSVKSVASSNAQEEHGAQKKELPNVLKKFSNSSHITKLEGMFANAGPASSKPSTSKPSTSFASPNNASVKEGQAFAQANDSTPGKTNAKSFVQTLQQEKQSSPKTKSVRELAKQLEEGGVFTQVLASKANATRSRF